VRNSSTGAGTNIIAGLAVANGRLFEHASSSLSCPLAFTAALTERRHTHGEP
jgi:hypothetical protein